MIYGLNFGGPDVGKAPVKFARHIKHLGARFALVGITDDPVERLAMGVTADNGRRRLTLRVRVVKGITYHAFYAA